MDMVAWFSSQRYFKNFTFLRALVFKREPFNLLTSFKSVSTFLIQNIRKRFTLSNLKGKMSTILWCEAISIDGGILTVQHSSFTM